MTGSLKQTHALLARLRRDIEVVAVHIARDSATKEELAQEMACRLLSLPPGQTRAWYLSRVGDHARKYWARTIIDAPISHKGYPILERRTVCVGGLRELDRIHRRQRAA